MIKEIQEGGGSHLEQHGPEGLLLHQALAAGGDVTLLDVVIWRQKSRLLWRTGRNTGTLDLLTAPSLPASTPKQAESSDIKEKL